MEAVAMRMTIPLTTGRDLDRVVAFIDLTDDYTVLERWMKTWAIRSMRWWLYENVRGERKPMDVREPLRYEAPFPLDYEWHWWVLKHLAWKHYGYSHPHDDLWPGDLLGELF